MVGAYLNSGNVADKNRLFLDFQCFKRRCAWWDLRTKRSSHFENLFRMFTFYNTL